MKKKRMSFHNLITNSAPYIAIASGGIGFYSYLNPRIVVASFQVPSLNVAGSAIMSDIIIFGRDLILPFVALFAITAWLWYRTPGSWLRRILKR